MWEANFGDRLRVRTTSQHKTRSECVKHKFIIRKLVGNRSAIVAQQKQWTAHLDRQYADRVQYWTCRSSSRLGNYDGNGCRTISIIIDSMDRTKWAVPRAAALATKELGNLQRPVLDVTLLLAHGHMCGVLMGDPRVSKGSSWTCECLLHVLDCLARQGVDLRDCELAVQADNCSKECKSNAFLKLLSYLVARGRVKRARLSCLVSGHSHEDVDQAFSLMGAYLQTQKELHNADAFENAASRFFQNPSVRPHEKLRVVKGVSQIRDWLLGLLLYRTCVFLFE